MPRSGVRVGNVPIKILAPTREGLHGPLTSNWPPGVLYCSDCKADFRKGDMYRVGLKMVGATAYPIKMLCPGLHRNPVL